MLEWQVIIGQTSFPADLEEDEYQSILGTIKYANDMEKAADEAMRILKKIADSNKGKDDDEDSLSMEIVTKMGKYIAYIRSVTDAKSLWMMVSDVQKKWAVTKMTSEKFHPVGFALQSLGVIDEEVNLVKSCEEVEILGTKIPLFETVSSVLVEPVVKDDPAFKKLLDPCFTFQEAFKESLCRCLKTLEESILVDVKAFGESYGPVVTAASTWSMEPVAWAFKGDQRKHDFDKFNDNLSNLKSSLNGFMAFLKHSSNQKDMVELQAEVKKNVQEAKALKASSCQAAAVTIFCVYFLGEQEVALDAIIKYAGDSYNVKVANLPDRLRKLVTDEISKKDLQDTGHEETKTKGTEKKEKKREKSDKKEKEKEKEKKKAKK